MQNEIVLKWINRNNINSKMTMSVCSGARLLGKLGLLDGQECITHHEVEAHLMEIAPKVKIVIGERFTDNGKILTSAGISAGIDLSLHIVEKLFGADTANKTRIYMEYGDWEQLKLDLRQEY
jgi:transcriptional regulator GlxA family with amidase domain